ncbi:amino acid permease [Danxiaibacter flavus]|uniref:Amino acid permease n=1 Tax=Danxiaibacter flavus TaxID=3049108 RepID=A0ABV3ZEJ5_9BACT|nr:amino acid permease [Chitinophagaceae bacterium DXS]
MSLFRKKSLEKIVAEAQAGELDGHAPGMNKVLGVRDLTFMGVAAVIGAGIFSTIGTAAFNGGPGVIFLFIITAITCGFTALCYAEFASRVPVSGSAYTYSYVTFGELIAWIIGWALILEYAIGNVVVAISWSAYFNNILKAIHINLPEWLTIGYQTAKMNYDAAIAANQSTADLVYTHAPSILGFKLVVNLPAFIIVGLITMLAYIGINESRRSANFMVGLKIVVLIFIAIVGFWFIFSNGTTDNWSPFLPKGMTGVLKGVSSVFFAYIGFDAISTTAEECSNPQRDLPRGMIYSLVICTIIYVVTTLVITGMVNYKEFEGVADPLAYVFDKINMHKIGFVISVSAVIAATSVLLVFQIGQPRIWMSMSRDGLLPKRFSTISPRYKTPGFATMMTGLLVGLPVLFVDDKLMTDLTSIGTLFAFVLVCGGVLYLPKLARQSGKFNIPYINGKLIYPVLVVLIIVLIALFKPYRFDDAFHGLYLKDRAVLQKELTVNDLNNIQSVTSGGAKTLSITKEQLNEFSDAEFGDTLRSIPTLHNKIFLGGLLAIVHNLPIYLFLLLIVFMGIFSFAKSFSLIPLLGVTCCAYLMIEIPAKSWMVFFGWMAIGLSIYFLYGRSRSKLALQR